MLPRRKHARMVTTQEVHCWAYAAYARTQALYSHERTNKRTNARQRVRGQTHAYTHTRTHTRRKLKHHAMVLAILEPTSPVSSSLDLWVQDRCAWHLVDHALDPTSSAEVQCQLLAQLHLGECSTLRSRESQNKGWQYGKSKRASEQASKHARKRANAAHRTRRARSAGISTTPAARTVSTAQ